MINTKQAIIQALADLGDTEDKVYRSLKDLGIQGIRAKAGMCPIANYLKSKLSPPQNYLTISSHQCTFVVDDFAEARYENTGVPTAIGNFIVHFDNGYYDDLVDPIVYK